MAKKQTMNSKILVRAIIVVIFLLVILAILKISKII